MKSIFLIRVHILHDVVRILLEKLTHLVCGNFAGFRIVDFNAEILFSHKDVQHVVGAVRPVSNIVDIEVDPVFGGRYEFQTVDVGDIRNSFEKAVHRVLVLPCLRTHFYLVHCYTSKLLKIFNNNSTLMNSEVPTEGYIYIISLILCKIKLR